MGEDSGKPARFTDATRAGASEAGRPAAARSRSALAPGAVLGGRYLILALLGQGGMGAVYTARDRELERTVALKMILPELAEDPAALERFKQELVMAREVTHKNVVRIYDFADSDGLKFITMEYVAGEPLGSVLQQRGKLPPAEAVEIIRQVCTGLEAAHEKGVIHRDLKPGNIMRDGEGRIVLMDFGLARSLEGGGLTLPGTLAGTLDYMSPEQAAGATIDQRSDLFAVGLVFYELLTGRRPYQADSAIASLLKRSQERPARPDSLDANIPAPLSDICSKCLAIAPEKRYASAAELLSDLEAWQRGAGTSRAARLRRAGARLRWFHAAVVAAALVAVAATIIALRLTRRPVQAHSVSVLVADFANNTSDAVFDGTLEPVLTLALEGAPFITSYSRGQARKVAGQLRPGASSVDEKLARLIAVREGVNVVVSGTISAAGDRLWVSVKAVDAVTGKEIVSREAETGSKDDVLKSVAKLAGSIRNALGDKTPESVQLAAAETFSSGSLEAAHHYAAAQALGFLGPGKWEEAIAEYAKAVSIDPKLGRAYSGMAVAYANLGEPRLAEKYFQLALAHLDRMTDREKYRTLGGYYLVTRNADKAVEEYSALVKQFPGDNAGVANLAYAYFLKRDMANALAMGRRSVEIYPNAVPQRNNLGLYAMYAGDFDTAIQEQQKVLEMNPSFALAYVGLALSQTAKGNVTEARSTWAKLQALGPHGASIAAAGLADLALYEGRVKQASALLEKAIATDVAAKEPDNAAEKYVMLAAARLQAGDANGAIKSAERALSFSKSDSVVFRAARAYAEAGQDRRALALADILAQRLSPEPRMCAKLVRGEVELKRRSYAAAIALFQEAQKMGDAWLAHFDLGRAYLEVGAYAEARSEFELCLRRRGEASAVVLDEVSTARLFPLIHYYLGRAQEGLKDPSAALSFKTFLEMKSEGEEPLVADARRRISKAQP